MEMILESIWNRKIVLEPFWNRNRSGETVQNRFGIAVHKNTALLLFFAGNDAFCG